MVVWMENGSQSKKEHLYSLHSGFACVMLNKQHANKTSKKYNFLFIMIDFND